MATGFSQGPWLRQVAGSQQRMQIRVEQLGCRELLLYFWAWAGLAGLAAVGLNRLSVNTLPAGRVHCRELPLEALCSFVRPLRGFGRLTEAGEPQCCCAAAWSLLAAPP